MSNTEEDYIVLNRHVLTLMESMYGDITPNFRKIWITLNREQKPTIHILLETECAEDREAIVDFTTDFEAKQGRIEYDVDVTVSSEAMPICPTLNLPHRYVYVRKEALEFLKGQAQ